MANRQHLAAIHRRTTVSERANVVPSDQSKLRFDLPYGPYEPEQENLIKRGDWESVLFEKDE